MANLFGGILTLVMTVVLVTAVAIPTIKGVNSTGWTTSEVATLGIVSIVCLFGLAYSAGAIFGMFG